MECRTPLVQIIPRAYVGDAAGYAGRGGGRWSSRPAGIPTQSALTQPHIKKRLPLPKNVVLMSLIEATELAAESVRSQEQRPSLDESPHLTIPNAILDIEEEEEEKIRAGTSLAISECGTYAIAAKDGLEIFPSRPVLDKPVGNEQGAEDEEVDTLVRFFHLDHKVEIRESQTKDDDYRTEAEYKENTLAKLRWGDRVQIVSTEAGWAKLARGYGYVRADKNQLVKGTSGLYDPIRVSIDPRMPIHCLSSFIVGSSVDRACKLEALLRLLSTRRKELRGEQKKVDNQFISLMNELQVSLLSDEDLTVIAADTFKQKRTSESIEEIKMDKIDFEQPLSQEVPMGDNYYDDSTPLKPRPMERPMTPPNAIESARGFFCTTSDMFNAVMPLSSGGLSRSRAPIPHATPKPAIVAHLAQTNSNLSSSTGESTPPPRLFPSASNPSPSALRAGARAWREIHGQPSGDVFGGIDFRTGMSGHPALNRTASSHPHDYLNPRVGTVNFRGGFSNHSGLTMWKKKSTNRGTSSNSHLAMPMFPGVDPPTHHHTP